MRLLFLFLLLVNGLVYLWYTGHQRPVRAVPAGMDAAAPKLVLLSEFVPAPAGEKKAADTKTFDAQSMAPGLRRLCYTLGPFMDSEAVSDASRKLMLSGRSFAKRASEKKERIGYWVFLPPMESHEAAADKAKELRELGEKHFYVVKQPVEYANAVSLGVFQSRKNAEGRYHQLRDLGYGVKLEGRFRQNPVYWLDYTEWTGSRQLGTQDFVGVQRLPRACGAGA